MMSSSVPLGSSFTAPGCGRSQLATRSLQLFAEFLHLRSHLLGGTTRGLDSQFAGELGDPAVTIRCDQLQRVAVVLQEDGLQ